MLNDEDLRGPNHAAIFV